MQQKIQNLRQELTEHRKITGNNKAMPKNFWPRVKELAKETRPRDLALQLGINPQNMNRRLGLQKQKKFSPKSTFVQIPSLPDSARKEVVEIQVTEKVTIKVFS